MRNVVTGDRHLSELLPDNDSIETIELEKTRVTCGIISTPELHFDSSAESNADNVLLKIKAFSCNYRDKGLVLGGLKRGRENSFYVVGSEFVGEVVALGEGVIEFEVGDRVIGNNDYVGPGAGHSPAGIPTDHASKEYQVFRKSKLIKVPEQMPDTIAAAFSLGSQTAYSMIRKLNLTRGSSVLIMAAKSNTSLAVLHGLKKHDVNVYAATTSAAFDQQFKDLGVKEIFHPARTPQTNSNRRTLADVKGILGGIDCIVDPFFDLHFDQALQIMACGGRYITCGLSDQYGGPDTREADHKESRIGPSLLYALINNLQIIGNCLGLTADLENALQDYSSGTYTVTIDSVYRGNQIGDFFNRTFNCKARFGKVIYEYE